MSDSPESVPLEVQFTLGALLDTLEAVLDIVIAPAGLDTVVRGPVIYDTAGGTDIADADVVLGVGVTTGPESIDDAIIAVAAARGVALIVKSSTRIPPAPLEVASRHGVALLRVAAHVDWGQLYSLIRTATLAASSGVAAGDDVRAVPLGDLFALANAIAGAVGGATTIEDRQLQVLAHSNLGHPVDKVRLDSIVGRRVPAEIRGDTEALYRRVWQQDGVVHVRAHPPSGSLPRLGAAVRAGSEVLGTVWVIRGDREFTASDESALGESAGLVALHLLRHTSAGDVDRRRRGALLEAAFDGRVSFSTVAATLGFGGRDHFTVAVLEVADSRGGDAETAHTIDRLVDITALHAESYRRSSATVAIGERVYLIVPDDAATPPLRRTELIEQIALRASHTLKCKVVAAIGSTVDDARRLVDSRNDADAALRARAEGTSSVVHIDEVLNRVTLHRLADHIAGGSGLNAGLVDQLEAHDAQNGTGYRDTVECYISSRSSVAEAATRMFVHPNTLRYRLRRIEETTGIDVDDLDTRFLLELEFRLNAERGR